MNLDLSVSGMSCGHCAAAVKTAIAEQDPNARVDVDLASGRVAVRDSQSTPQAIAAAVEAEGYVVKAIENVA